MAKTDWMLDDTVLPEDMNQIGEEINANADRLADNLDKQPWEPLTLNAGVQVIQGGDVPAIIHPTMQGRTLVNLLGRDGNCEDKSKITVAAGAVTLDSTNRSIGNNSFRLTGNTTVTYGRYVFSQRFDKTKNFLFVADMKSGSGAAIRFRVISETSGGILGSSDLITDITKFRTGHCKVAANSSSSNIVLEVIVTGNDSAFAYLDAVRVYEISQAEYNALASMTADQIAANYPYVDDMKHVNAVYIENKGKNLLSPFSEWSGEATVFDQYKVSGKAPGAYPATDAVLSLRLTIKAGQVYTLTNPVGNGKVRISSYDGAGVRLQGFFVEPGTSRTVTLHSNAEQIGVNLSAITAYTDEFDPATWTYNGSGTFNFANPMLNIGSGPHPFEPQKPSYLYLPDCNLRSNVDGSVADRLYTDGQGKPRVTRRFREMVLDGALSWVFNTDYTGYKGVRISNAFSNFIATDEIGIKYDGKILNTNTSGNGPDQINIGTDGILYLWIADTDSGWGESYTPTADEIKAYFNGWRMYPNGANAGTALYNGAGTKWWARRVDGVTTSDATMTDGTTALPTTLAPNFSPYRLMYQLVQSIDEPVTNEGSLMLHEGENQVEVGTGIVVREAAKPFRKPDGTVYWIEGASDPAYLLKYRPKRSRGVYRNGIKDNWREFVNATTHPILGDVYLEIAASQYDPTAAYSVTYLALDTYTLGIAPQTISAEYAPNIRESVESLVRELVESRTETSVLANTKAQKQQPQWIEPSLRNDWVNAASGDRNVRYMKDDRNVLHIQGVATSGIIEEATVLFVLPKDYRPKGGVNNIALSRGTSTGSFNLAIDTSGNVKLYFVPSGATTIYLDGISFPLN